MSITVFPEPVAAFESDIFSPAVRSLPEQFAEVARRHGERCAIRTASGRITYRELDELSNRYASALLDRLGPGNHRIAVCMETGIQAVVAMLAIWEAGMCSVPLQPAIPPARLRFILEDSGSKVLIATPEVEARTRPVSPVPILTDWDAVAIDAERPRSASIDVRTPVWLVYTSGSTGEPKGVIQNHFNLFHYTRHYHREMRLSPEDRILSLFSHTTNAGCHDVLRSLLTGATLVPWDANKQGFEELAAWINAIRPTLLCLVPTAFRQLVPQLTPESCPSLRLITMIGEPVLARDWELYRRYCPRSCRMLNRYGSTETGSVSWQIYSHDSQVDSAVLPIGLPVYDQEVELWDEEGRPVPDGEPGEIVIRSRTLSPGYWKRDEITHRVFRDLEDGWRLFLSGDMGVRLPDGRLQHLGRKDRQVKIRGWRIETAEIERALLAHEDIREAVVTGWAGNGGEKRLVAYYVPLPGRSPSISDLRRTLETSLPHYMMPAFFMALDALPTAPNGKVALRALPAPPRSRPEIDAAYVAPANPAEEQIVAIWTEVLRIAPIGVEDDFLLLGGSSLEAAQVVSRILRDFHQPLTPAELLREPTVRRLAARVAASPIEQLETLIADIESLPDSEVARRLDEDGRSKNDA